MSSVKIPDGYQHVMPYIILKGADAFKRFLEDVFEGKEIYNQLREDGAIMHAEVKIGESVIMFAEATDKWDSTPCALFVYVDDADKTFGKALRHDSKVLMEIADQSYGRTGGVKDTWGNTWWITAPLKNDK